jgi:hypothetical protein
MSNSDIIASVGLLFSMLAFIVSIKSLNVSKSSLSINKQQNDERSLGVHLYYIDAYKWRKESDTYISFALRFTNHSTLTNSISKVELHIEYHDENNIVGKVKVQSDTNVTPVNLKTYSDALIQPINLPEKSAISGWVTFKLPQFIKEKLIIDLYEVVAESIDNKKMSIETHIVNEV